jgi:hypothetical protein
VGTNGVSANSAAAAAAVAAAAAAVAAAAAATMPADLHRIDGFRESARGIRADAR